MAVEKQTSARLKKKEWYLIVAPPVLNEAPLGESLVAEPQSLIGRTIRINLMTITNDIKKQNINVQFKIDAIKERHAHTSIIGYEILPSSIRRLVRRGKSRVDDVVKITTKDGKKMRVKIFILTQSTINAALATSLRAVARQHLSSTISKMSYDMFCSNLIGHKLQNELWDRLKKIYPLRSCEIRKVELEKEAHHALKEKLKIKETASEQPVEEQPPAEVAVENP